MFTGIIEAVGTIVNTESENTNTHIHIAAPFISELKVDQSIAHNGVCLTVVHIEEQSYTVTAIEETLKKTTIQDWRVGHLINLERCLKIGERLDGHIVQGHIDMTAVCILKEDQHGSRLLGFEHALHPDYFTVPKGSITVDGVSLTVVDSQPDYFSVAIIPYTLQHTHFYQLEKGDKVNLEFDIIGKYISRYLMQYGKNNAHR